MIKGQYSPGGDTPDFGALGSEFYRGSLDIVPSAILVEPPGITALLRVAADKLARLSDLAVPHSGIPTRAVQYFCLEELEDGEELRSHGISTARDRERLALVVDGRGMPHVIERESLRPLVRRPGDIAGKISIGLGDLGGARLFYVHDDLDKLVEKRLSRTVDYIRYGE
ncbi:MAG: hypothetical protein P1T08_18955, partial [Acidimicrobiia bacterium]|nr:hypothetical protein [Acidimicrobiia bacterium]